MSGIECRNCIAVCCGPNIEVQLTDDEADFIKSAGTSLQQVMPPLPIAVFYFQKPKVPDLSIALNSSKIPAGHGLYILKERCGHVVEKDGWLQCGAYNDLRRPKVCGDFPIGDNTCREIRKSRGVDR